MLASVGALSPQPEVARPGGVIFDGCGLFGWCSVTPRIAERLDVSRQF